MSPRRRQLLAALGVGAVAGCLGDDDSGNGGDGNGDDSVGNGDDSGGNGDDSGGNGDDDSGNGGGGEPVTDTYTTHISPATNIEQIGFNTWNPTTQLPGAVSTLMWQNALYDKESEATLEPLLITDWEANEDDLTYTFTVSDEFEWANGEPVTAEDFATASRIMLGMNDGATDEYEDVTVDGNQFVHHLTEWANPDILIRIFRHRHYYRDGPFAEFAQRFEDASEGGYEDVKTDLEEFELKPREGDELHASGPWMVDQVTDNYFTMVPNPGHPHNDDVNYEKIELIKTGEWSTVQGLLMSENLHNSGGGRFATTFIDSVPDRYYMYYDQRYGGNSIDFMMADDIYGIREVRMALNHIVDKQRSVDAIDYEQEPDQYSTGMIDSIAESWIDQETLDSFTDYTGQNFDEAARLLEQAGFEEGSNTWQTPDGEDWTVQFSAPAGDADRVQQMEVARDLVRDFGINAELSTIETSTYWQRYRDQDWQIAVWTYGDRFNAHPYFDFMHYYIGEDPDLLPGEREPWNGMPYEVEVPGEVGNPDSDLETINYYELIQDLRTASDEETSRELITECAWIWNQWIPKVPIAVEQLPYFIDTQDWDLGDNYEQLLQDYQPGYPHNFLANKGQFRAREE